MQCQRLECLLSSSLVESADYRLSYSSTFARHFMLRIYLDFSVLIFWTWLYYYNKLVITYYTPI
jgi:hypothetical protein